MIQKLLITVGLVSIVFSLFNNTGFALGVGPQQTFTQYPASVRCVNGLPEVILSWAPLNKALYYKIQRKNIASAPWSGLLDSQIKNTRYVDVRWKNDYGAMKFYYRIVAAKGGSTVYSSEVSIAVPRCKIKSASTVTPLPTTVATPIPTTTPQPTSAPAVATTRGEIPPGVKWGVYVGWHSFSMVEFEALTDKKPAMEMVFVHWGNEIQFPSYYGTRIRDQGRTMVLFWEASDFKRDLFSQPEYSYDAVLAGTLDNYFKRFAEGAKAYGGSVILIPYSEFNGNWYPWGGTIGNNTPQKHIAAYRYIRGFFKDVPNVKFGWVPNGNSVPNTDINQLELYYPGDDVVDYVGVDGFNFGGSEEQTFTQLFDSTLTRLKSFKKPIYIFSIASAGGPGKAAWIKDALTVQLYKHPEVVGWLWFNQNKERDWQVNSDAASLSAFISSLP